MTEIQMLIDECKVIARHEVPEVMAINDQLDKWADDAEEELARMSAVVEAAIRWRTGRALAGSLPDTCDLIRAIDAYEEGK